MSVFSEAVTATATAIEAAGYRAVTDPRNIAPRCVFVELPTFTSFTTNVADITISLKFVAAPPGNNDAMDWILTAVDALLAAGLAIVDGRPITWLIGGQELPAYDCTIRIGSRRT